MGRDRTHHRWHPAIYLELQFEVHLSQVERPLQVVSYLLGVNMTQSLGDLIKEKLKEIDRENLDGFYRLSKQMMNLAHLEAFLREEAGKYAEKVTLATLPEFIDECREHDWVILAIKAYRHVYGVSLIEARNAVYPMFGRTTY